ncbi:MAG: tetratricopeptide repeat protein [Acetatifactor sp.]|nr:tetratricopeptide repeat protein [Acetatifactor sp.]
MFCYHCGCQLSEHDFCTACGADVSLYKKIMYVSNRFYNDGLEKAGVRDLSGAINSLRQSLKFNKNNIDARNLLGLIYFETGEAVAALSEWVISKNLRPDKNIADDYISMIQSNASRLDSINQTIKKYNQAYAYCIQDSKDLAIIQLKKVLSLNPKFVQAHQLLALLYMDSEQWERARKELQKCVDIDRNNTLTLRYLKEVELMLAPDENAKQPAAKRKKDNTLRYQSDNEVIIQPLNVREQKGGGVSTLVNIGIGLVIGLAAMYFLVVPSRVASIRSESDQIRRDLGEQLDAKTLEIQDLEGQVNSLQAELDEKTQELENYAGTDGTLSSMDNLLAAAAAYLDTEDVDQAATNLESIADSVVIEEMPESFQRLYNTLLGIIGPGLAKDYYNEGYRLYYNEADYEAALEQFTKAVFYNNDNVDALFYLARSYHRLGDFNNANLVYDDLIERFPNTDRAKRSQEFKNDMAGSQ